jgi:hypothetical protein
MTLVILMFTLRFEPEHRQLDRRLQLVLGFALPTYLSFFPSRVLLCYDLRKSPGSDSAGWSMCRIGVRRSRSNCLQTMESLPTILLKPGEADRIVAGHPWVYHGSVLRMTAQAGDGEMVQVKDHRQRLLGVGYYNSKSRINVRVLAPERVEVDQNFFEERIRTALA